MTIAITGATGFVGRELVAQLVHAGHTLKCWCRPDSNFEFAEQWSHAIETVPGELGGSGVAELIEGCDTVVHAALWRVGESFMDNEGDLVEYARVNLLGTLELMEAAYRAGVKKFVFVSTCAVHDVILDDRPLDEAHPLWPRSHYGAHKGALEKFVHSYGLGKGFPICALRPTGIYGVADPLSRSKWFSLVQKITRGEPVTVERGGKEVHVSDVAKAIRLLIDAPEVAGQSYACYDRYVSEYDVATLAKKITGSNSPILGEPRAPKHQIKTDKIRALGMEFGGEPLLEQTIREMIGLIPF